MAVIAFSFFNKKPASAQFNATPVICDEPIPIGKAYEETLKLMDNVYTEYQNVRYYLSSAIEQIQSEIADLYENKDTICDYSKCVPLVIDQGPEFSVEFDYLIGTEDWDLPLHVPFCSAQTCIGEPCPDTDKYLKDITAFRDAVNGSYEIINDVFNNATIIVPEEIRIKKGPDKELVGAKITIPEQAKRYIYAAREWVHDTPSGERNCTVPLNEMDEVQQGIKGDRYPMKCIDALELGLYWPRPWSESCNTECALAPTDECIDCLAQCKGNSVLANLNCKIYSTCGSSCNTDKINKECLNCLCTDENGERLSNNQCASWICGGSRFNYVCCHETPLFIDENI